MTTVGSAQMRCINCKREVKDDQEFCKCGDRVMTRAKPELVTVQRLERELAETLTEHTAASARRAGGIRRELARTNPHPRAGLELLPEEVTLPEEAILAVAPGMAWRPGRALPDSSNDVGRPAVQLTAEQESALGAVADWYAGQSLRSRSEMPFRLFGPAGTGKTTLARHIAAKLGITDVVFGAYTGKAAHVLRRKGVPATTIHSAIYKPVDNREARVCWEQATRELEDLKEEYAEAISLPDGGSPDVWSSLLARKEELEQEVADLEQAIKQGVQFKLDPFAEWGSADLIVLDEVSMVNESLALDIESFGVPVLVLGDPFQLPPVEGGGYYTNVKPDVLLTEIHRQALQSPVLSLATAVRRGQDWHDHLVKVNLEAAMIADQILCWKNSTRINLTGTIRKKLGRPDGIPVPGDRVMCLVNNKDIGVFNGQQFEVLEAPGAHLFDNTDRERYFLLRDDEGREVRHYFDPDGFRGLDGEKEAKARRRHRGRTGLFTFANVITVHKSQGSEWDHVYVVDQTEQMWKSSAREKARWMYTAITRASECVTLASTAVR